MGPMSHETEPDPASIPRQAPPSSATTLRDWAAAALVFGSSAAVLVIELVALRLLAPYLGLTLETNTLVIGLALAAIAVGSWWGGWAADRTDPRRALAPLLAISGAGAAATPFLVRAAGAAGGSDLVLPVSAITIMIPGLLLSAVTPMVTKMRLRSLTETGSVVGRLSGIGTAGSIVGTVATGFILISRVPVTGILVGLGVCLLLTAAAVEVGRRTTTAAAAAAVAVGALAATVAPGGCDVETTYHCVLVAPDPQNESGRTLVMDGLRHSYVDLDDPEHLEFRYIRALAAGIDAHTEGNEAVRAHHLGGGGLTLPRYLAVQRPGTHSTVSEIDAGVVRVDQDELGLEENEDLQVRVEDGRLGMAAVETDSVDVVVGDAFGGVSVPWHLTTVEALEEVSRILHDDGLYAANLIDRPPLEFARAQVETLEQVFTHVALATDPETAEGRGGGNLVALASNAPLDTAAWQASLLERDTLWRVLEGEDLDAWVGDSPVLTDDFAPVDQLLTPYATR